MLTATVLGLAYESPTVDFPARTGPGTGFGRTPFTVRKDTSGLEVLDVQPDADNTMSNFSRVYQWFHLRLADGSECWMRDHVIGIQGDFSVYGYGNVAELVHAYTLVRDMSAVKATKTEESAKTEPAEAPKTTETEESAKPAETSSNPLAAAAANAAAQNPVDEVDATTATSEAAPAEGKSGKIEKADMDVAKPTGPAVAIPNTQAAANTRSGPGTSYDRSFTIPRGTSVSILAVQREVVGNKYRWFRVAYDSKETWIREDLCKYDGDTEPFDLPTDLYPTPMANCWWVRGYNMPPDIDSSTWQHDGWDLGAQTGEPLLAGHKGGTVIRSFECSKCNPDGRSTLQAGFQIGDSRIYSDQDWGWGYGHHVIVRYTNDQLPESTQKALAARGFAGGTMFVMYAHMYTRSVADGQALGAGAIIGTCGNSGNSEATHLHLEVRASNSPNFSGWAAIRSGVMDPVVLFKR
jgi:uncharacterized protein YraI